MKLHRNEKFVKWGMTAFAVFVACALFWMVFSNLTGFYELLLKFIDIISPLLYGVLFAYLMNPVMEWCRKHITRILEKRKKSMKPRTVEALSSGLSVGIAVIAFLAMIYAFIAMIVPSLIQSITDLLEPTRLQGYYDTVNNWLNQFVKDTGIADWLRQNLDDLLKWLTDTLKKIDFAAIISNLTSSVYNFVMGIFNALIGVVAAVYFLIYKKQLFAHAKKITVALFTTTQANRLFEVARRTNRIFGGYVMGKIIDSLIVGVITYVALLIMKMPYAPLISVLVAVTNIIPFFGPFIGAIPATLLLLIDNPMNALYFVIFTVILQQIDGNIIANRILGDRLGISDLWVLAAILVFGGVFGFAGMLLGVPIFAVIYSLVADWINRRLAQKRYPLDAETYYSLRCVEDLPVKPLPSYSYVSVEPAYDMKAEAEEEEDLDCEE